MWDEEGRGRVGRGSGRGGGCREAGTAGDAVEAQCGAAVIVSRALLGPRGVHGAWARRCRRRHRTCSCAASWWLCSAACSCASRGDAADTAAVTAASSAPRARIAPTAASHFAQP